MVGRPRQSLACITLVATLLFACAYTAYVASAVSTANLGLAAWVVLVGKTAVELIAGTFGIAFLATALGFLAMREAPAPRQRQPDDRACPPIGIVYLCCDDADRTALDSLTTLSYPGPLFLVIHDDSRSEQAQQAVDRMAATLARRRAWDVSVLRRPDRSGGKPAAVNHVLDRTGHLYDYFLLCDNDSTILHPDTLQQALAHLEPGDVGGVQFRSVPVADQGYCAMNRRLSDSIGAFHAFLAPASRYGWMPFIGHNALLRTRAVREVGGLTPGCFSDDLDLTVRLNLAGFRIVYAAGIEMGEKHPPSYTAFRKRSYKWAYGCVQTLRAHTWQVVTSRRFSLAEKLSFLQFAGFYCLQSLLLAYLCFVLIAVPLGALGDFTPLLVPSLIVGTVLVGLVYAPLLSFYLKTGVNRRPGWPTTLALCGLVYGGTDFSVLRGVADGFGRRQRSWTPTNGVTATAADPTLFAEAAFGLMLLAVPIMLLPELLYLPCWFLFAGKFLFAPALSLLYRDDPHHVLASVSDTDGDSRRHRVVLEPVGGSVFERAGS
jgi:1,2-diacylglycerol 3-beta-glucosyltransferase